MLVLAYDELIGLIPPLQLVDAIEDALRAQAAGKILMPDRLHMSWDKNTLLAMPAASDVGVGVKLVSVVPGNAARGLPVTGGIMILNDRDTGVPMSLMNAAALTALRTGAVGVLGIRYQTPVDTDSIGIVGCGMQGTWQAIFACAIRPIRKVLCLDSSTIALKKFATTVQRHAPDVDISVCESPQAMLNRTNLIVTTTTATQPVLPDEPDLLENKHFISVGSFKPSMQELPNSVYRLAGKLAVDSRHAIHEVGDVINPIRQGILREEDVFSIAELVTRKRSVDTGRTTVYKSVGAALFDLYAARALHSAALVRGIGRKIEL